MSIDDLTLNAFKDAVGRGTRPNRYTLSLTIPGHGSFGAEVSATNLPEASLPAIPIPFRGRVLKLPGDRRYSPWTFTVYDTEGGDLWQRLHSWSNDINNHITNETDYSFSEHNATWTLNHYDLNGGSPIKEMKLYGCWPSLVGPFELQAGAMDTLSQFQCTVEYEYFEIV